MLHWFDPTAADFFEQSAAARFAAGMADDAQKQVGDVQNVFFPCAALTDGDRISVYYGAADTVTGLAHGHISDLIAFARER